MLECEWRVAERNRTSHTKARVTASSRAQEGSFPGTTQPMTSGMAERGETVSHGRKSFRLQPLQKPRGSSQFLLAFLTAISTKKGPKVRGPRKSSSGESLELGLIARHLDFDIPASLHYPSTAGRAKPGALVASPGA